MCLSRSIYASKKRKRSLEEIIRTKEYGLTLHFRGLFYSRERIAALINILLDMVGTDGEKSRKKIKKSYSSLLLHYLLTHKTCSESKHTQNCFCLLARSSATSQLQFPMFYQSPRWIQFLFLYLVLNFCMSTSSWQDNHRKRTEA